MPMMANANAPLSLFATIARITDAMPIAISLEYERIFPDRAHHLNRAKYPGPQQDKGQCDNDEDDGRIDRERRDGFCEHGDKDDNCRDHHQHAGLLVQVLSFSL